MDFLYDDVDIKIFFKNSLSSPTPSPYTGLFPTQQNILNCLQNLWKIDSLALKMSQLELESQERKSKSPGDNFDNDLCFAILKSPISELERQITKKGATINIFSKQLLNNNLQNDSCGNETNTDHNDCSATAGARRNQEGLIRPLTERNLLAISYSV